LEVIPVQAITTQRAAGIANRMLLISYPPSAFRVDRRVGFYFHLPYSKMHASERERDLRTGCRGSEDLARGAAG